MMGTLFQIREALEPPAKLVTVYFVKSYWRDRDRLAEGRFEQFASMEVALRAGARAAVKAAGVRVCRVRGNPGADYWEEPVQIARWGDVPPL
jgi:hypothetical protein